MMARMIAAALSCLPLVACGGGNERPRSVSEPLGAQWRGIATRADRERLRNWRAAWGDAMAQTRGGGQATAMAPHGVLFEPDRALAGPVPPPGDYRCRTFKLGARLNGVAEFVSYPWFACRIEQEGDMLSFAKDTGSQRPVGLVFRDGDTRAIFLGTLLLGDESTPLRYGQDRARDMAGIVQRVGERRWRLTLPYPAFESTLDVIELVPAA